MVADMLQATVSPIAAEPVAAPPATPDATETAADARRAAIRYSNSVAAPALILLPLAIWCVASIRERIPAPMPHESGRHANILQSRIDPNTAPWWELTALPQVGESVARRITDYRAEYVARPHGRAAFQHAGDLDPVRGVGPKTIERVRPHLRFDQPARSRPPGSPLAPADDP